MVVAPQSKALENVIKMQERLSKFNNLGSLSLAANSQVAALATSDTVTNLAKASAGMSRIISAMSRKDYSCPTSK